MNHIEELIEKINKWSNLNTRYLLENIGEKEEVLVIDELINRKPDININEIFLGVCLNDNIDKMVHLLNLGADINYGNGDAIVNALFKKKQLTINFLIDHHIKMTSKIFEYAIRNDNISIVKICINDGMPIGQHEIAVTIIKERYDVLQLFLDNGVDINLICKIYYELLFECECNLTKEMLVLLRDNGIDFNLLISQITI